MIEVSGDTEEDRKGDLLVFLAVGFPPGVMPRWFNAGTRAILIQMTFYNTNTKQLTNLRLLFEVFFSGQFLNSYQFDTAKIVVYQSKTDQVRSAQEIVAEPCACLRLLDPPMWLWSQRRRVCHCRVSPPCSRPSSCACWGRSSWSCSSFTTSRRRPAASGTTAPTSPTSCTSRM